MVTPLKGDNMFRDLKKYFWKKLVDFVGDIRSLNGFPWVTWAPPHDYKVDLDEVLYALKYLIKPGDVGLHRDEGYLSNVAIPGFMKHAWVHVEPLRDDGTAPKIVEAVGEGVRHVNAIVPLKTDYAIIVRPKTIKHRPEGVKVAVDKAMRIIGENYDVDFDFDIEKEVEFFTGPDSYLGYQRTTLLDGVEHLRGYDPAFSCTEVASFAWWHESANLCLYRSEARGKKVILADQFLNPVGWEIVWLSKSVTPEVAKKMGLKGVGVSMIKDWIDANPELR